MPVFALHSNLRARMGDKAYIIGISKPTADCSQLAEK